MMRYYLIITHPRLQTIIFNAIIKNCKCQAFAWNTEYKCLISWL